MISQAELQKIATKLQTDPATARREYAQHLFLKQFYQNEPTKDILFKGGTALRIIYNSPRFSEDLDFSTNLQKLPHLERILEDCLTELERENITTDILESKETTGGYLALISFSIHDKEVRIKLELSYRETGCHGGLTVIDNPYLPPYTLYALDQVQLVNQKLTALLTRQKPRDFYDLYYLLRANLLSPENKGLLEQINEVLNKTNIDFEKELKIFLPRSHWKLIENFKPTLSAELKRYL